MTFCKSTSDENALKDPEKDTKPEPGKTPKDGDGKTGKDKAGGAVKGGEASKEEQIEELTENCLTMFRKIHQSVEQMSKKALDLESRLTAFGTF